MGQQPGPTPFQPGMLPPQTSRVSSCCRLRSVRSWHWYWLAAAWCGFLIILVWFFNNYSVSFGGSSDVTATSSVVPPKSSELPVPRDAGVSDIQHTINLAVEHAVADFGGQASIAGARFKGDWGPDETGGYMARQMGRVPQAGVDGCVGVTVLARPADGTYSTAQQMLNSMVRDISRVLEASDTSAG